MPFQILLSPPRFFVQNDICLTDILEEMARRLPKAGGVSFQTEDEIAAIGSVVAVVRRVTPPETSSSNSRPSVVPI